MSDGRNQVAEKEALLDDALSKVFVQTIDIGRLEKRIQDLQLDNERLRSTLRWIGQYDPSPDFRRIANKAQGGGDWVIINHMMAEATRALEGKDG